MNEKAIEAAAFAICATELEDCELCSLETMKRCACLTQARAALTAAQPLLGVEREWVSVKDRLPDLDQVVLVHYPRFDGTPTCNWGARVDGGEGWCWGVKGGYGGSVHLGKDASYNDIEVDDDYPVTHWKPLDPPPTLLAEKQTVKP